MMLSPFVYWGQTEAVISLRVDLKNVKKPLVDLNETSLKFFASGTGARGINEYCFAIDFYEPIDPQNSFYKIIDRHIEFVIRKRNPDDLWPRLCKSQVKPAWLQVDFDKLHTEDSEEENLDDWNHTSQNSFRDLGNKDFGRRRKSQRMTAEEFRKVYLFLYNLFQFVGFTFMLVVLTIRYAKEGPHSMVGSYIAVGRVMKFLTLMQILEIVHPLLGYTSGKALYEGLQLLFRMFMIFIMVDGEPRMQVKPVVFYLFLIYTCNEIVRYPYYMLRVFRVNVAMLTWLRWTLWTVLYPLAFLCEGVIMLRNIPYLEEEGNTKFSIYLPNHWNFSFSMPWMVRIFLLTGFFPSLYLSMNRLYHARLNVCLTAPKSWRKDLRKEA